MMPRRMSPEQAAQMDEFTKELFFKGMEEVGSDDVVVMCLSADVPHNYDDDVDATCMKCEAAVYHRPWVPEYVKTMCEKCVNAEMTEVTADNPTGFVTAEHTEYFDEDMALARRAATECAGSPMVQVTMPLDVMVSVSSQLQLALRLPNNIGPNADDAREWVTRFQASLLVDYPAAAKILAMGWDTDEGLNDELDRSS